MLSTRINCFWSVWQSSRPQALGISDDIFRSVVRPQFVLQIGNAQLGIKLLQPLPRIPGFYQAPGKGIARRRDARSGNPATRAMS